MKNERDLHYGIGHFCGGCDLSMKLHKGCPALNHVFKRGEPSDGVNNGYRAKIIPLAQASLGLGPKQPL